MNTTKLLAGLLCVVLSLPTYAKDSLAIGSIDVPALSNRLKQLGVYYHEGVLECEEGAIEVEGNRLHTPTLALLFEAKKDINFYDDFVYYGGNSAFPSNLFDLVKNSKDQQYAKKITKQLLCEKIDLTSRTLTRNPGLLMGSMVAGGLELLSSKRIDLFDYKSAKVPRTALDCYFARPFFPEGDVGIVCDPYYVDTPDKLKVILSKELKISRQTAAVLYKKVEDFVSLTEDELRATGYYFGSCNFCNAKASQEEVELLIYQALTIFRTGRPLICEAVRDGNNPCTFSDYEAGLLGAEEQQTYELVDAELNKQWGLLKRQAATSERWKDVLDTQRAWVRMKVALIKSGQDSSAAYSEKVATFLTKHRSKTLTYVRELFRDAQ
ncbi:hypothetical protein OAH95_00550 [Burkholderiaceae bacterium]|nr:hypothetical protein [Burkholderiaceae bacterium]